jgi:membrane-associated phospholipid phosphatase
MNHKTKQELLDSIGKLLDRPDCVVRVQSELCPATKQHPADSNQFVTGNRRTIIVAATISMLLLCTSAHAQQTTGEKVADIGSTVLVGVNIGADGIYSFKHHCGAGFIVKNVASIASAEMIKHIIPEDRPDHSDNKSFPSEHSWLAAANTGWSYKIGWTITFGTMGGRVLANKHHPHDTLLGALAGTGVQSIVSLLLPCHD